MEPGEDQGERLTDAVLGRKHPESEHDPGIRVVGAEAPPRDARAHDVDDEQRGQQEPQRVLRGLPERHAKASPVVQEPERQHAVHGDRAVERERAGSAPPQGEEPPPARGHRVERDQAEGVVGEVKGEVEE